MFHKKKNISLSFFCILSALINISGQTYAIELQASDIYEKAIHGSPLIKKFMRMD